ncbi:SDR family NAD(P)-dependent oxidoreductase [Bacillus massilinigeriensis]|uniref:SDR family NAD(P)-dependent oxidoreductase n=1 Tax=Bacillus massilionigeriensis TaxID=1805475 RepID=UPI00096B020F|nr:glucose 1-dehydrogenase [Bacillus massilionigeriensis]
MEFNNKVALITGGTSGIGLSVAASLAQKGAKVVVVGRNSSKGEEAIQELKQIHSDVVFLSKDVSQSSEIKQMVDETLSIFGTLDFAFNNACHAEMTPARTHEFSEEDFDRMMGITIKSVWLCMKYELQAMLKGGGGSIVNTSSLDAFVCHPGITAYTVGKSGIITLSKCVAREYGKQGIRVNTLTPGAIRTPMIERKFEGLSKEEGNMLEEKYQNINALGRMGTPEEAANVVTWLMSEKSSYITGQNIILDGGVSYIS